MAISKIILNGVTQMDLTSDTVAAANLIAPNTAHGANGEAVVGTATAGVDMPVFTDIWSNDWNTLISTTCNKTVRECLLYFNNGVITATVISKNQADTEEYSSYAYVSATGSDDITYTYCSSGIVPFADIKYNANGTIVETIPSKYYETLNVTQNGTYYPEYMMSYISEVNVNVPSGTPMLQAKTNIAPTTSSQTITPDSGYDGLSSVQINAMPSGTAGTPTATKGSVSNHSVSVTPSVTNTTGYITGSTKTGTAVSVSASELVSGNLAISQNGNNIDVANYSTVSVNVSGGSSKAVYTYKGLASRTANSYGATSASVTVAKAGTYTISYVAIRGSSSGTMGTNLHIGSTSGTNNTTWTGTYAQSVTLTGQTIAANTTVTIYATSGNNSRTIYVGNLIVEEQ